LKIESTHRLAPSKLPTLAVSRKPLRGVVIKTLLGTRDGGVAAGSEKEDGRSEKAKPSRSAGSEAAGEVAPELIDGADFFTPSKYPVQAAKLRERNAGTKRVEIRPFHTLRASPRLAGEANLCEPRTDAIGKCRPPT
jgi:hypothetical protein